MTSKASTILLHLGDTYTFTDKTIPKEAAFGRTFIYTMLLNAGDDNHIPVFVDSTNNFKKRLSKHKVLSWHNNRFNKPVLIEVLGTISSEYADKAVAELKQALIDHEISYYKHVVNWGAKRIDTFSDLELAEYLQQNHWDFHSIIDKWKQKWQIKGKADDKTVRSAKQREKDLAQPKLVETEEIILEHFDKELVQTIMKTRSYKNKFAVRVGQSIAMNYDQETGFGYYDVWIPSNAKRARFRRNELEQTNKYISHDWQFVTQKPIATNETGATRIRYSYKLTQPIKKALLKASEQAVNKKKHR